MALLLQEAEKLSLDDLRMGIIEEIITEDPMFNYINFIQANAGKTHTYIRESREEIGSNFRAPGETITEGASGVDPITLVIKAIIDDTNVDSFIQDTMSDHFDQTAVQISLRAKSVARRFRNALVNGGKVAAALPTGSGNPANTTTSWIDPATIVGTANIHGGVGVIRITNAATTLASNFTQYPALYSGPSGSLSTVVNGVAVYPAIVDGDVVVQFKAPGDAAFGRPVVVAAAASYTVPSDNLSKSITFTTATATTAASIVGGVDGVIENAHVIVNFTESSEFAGLFNLVDSSQQINGGGAALAFTQLDEISDKLRGYGAPMHVASLSQVRRFKTLLRIAGGTNSAMLQMENFSRPILTLEDAPVFKNDFIDESGATTSWFGVKTGDQGLTGVYAGNTAGVAVEDLGPRETVNARGYRVKLYGALALYSTQALVEINNLPV